MKPSICVLASGGLGYACLEHLLHQGHQVKSVFTNKASTEIIELAQSKKWPLYIGNPRKEAAKEFIERLKTDLILSINYLFLIPERLIKKPRLYAINFHGSLLPKYRGRTPHVWAIINGESQTGISAHIMEESVDSGDLILQHHIPIEPEDTGHHILEKFKQQYPLMLDEILARIQDNRLSLQAQDDDQATYFGKRTPEDGAIDWHWQANRIINWVRAQAPPYPGAFNYAGRTKLIFKWAKTSNLGFKAEDVDGLILKQEGTRLWVKCPNMVLELELHHPNDLENNAYVNMVLSR